MPVALLGLALLAQTPDRSGEAALRAVFATYGKLAKFEASIAKSSRDRKEDALLPTLSFMLAYDSPTRFRLEQSEYWGGGTTYVQDGTTLKLVSADGGPTRLRNAGKSLMTSFGSLAPGGGSFSLLFLFLEGPRAFDKLVAADSSITRRGNWISLKTKDFGEMSLHLDGKLIVGIEFDNKALRMASYRFTPMFGDPPEDPLEVEAISYRFVDGFPRHTFDTSVRPGEPVIDERKKG